MEILKIKNLSYSYSKESESVLRNIDLSVNRGEFVLLCGKNGSGKSTLLKLIKSDLNKGEKTGEILCNSNDFAYLGQGISEQQVCDTCCNELAFGLENQGLESNEIKLRIAEISNYFGIEKLFKKKLCELSGGEKQLVNIAALVAMRPKVLLLDEPLSQLDVVSSERILSIISKLNHDLGITIIMTEHNVESCLPLADKLIILDEGKVGFFDNPRELGNQTENNKYYFSSAMKIYSLIKSNDKMPISIREGRDFLEKSKVELKIIKSEGKSIAINEALSCKNIYFAFAKNEKDILKGIDLKLNYGEILSISGGNGAGKTTLLNVLLGLNKAYSGKVKFADSNSKISYLPQDLSATFAYETVLEELLYCNNQGLNLKERIKRLTEYSPNIEIELPLNIKDAVDKFGISELVKRNPFELSGGEKQLVALCKAYIKNSDIYLLDEPSHSLGADKKEELCHVLKELKLENKAILIVSHDIEFLAECADKCALLFDGEIVFNGGRRDFILNNDCYTTNARKLTKGIFEDVISIKEIINV